MLPDTAMFCPLPAVSAALDRMETESDVMEVVDHKKLPPPLETTAEDPRTDTTPFVSVDPATVELTMLCVHCDESTVTLRAETADDDMEIPPPPVRDEVLHDTATADTEVPENAML